MWMRAGFGEIGTLQDIWLASYFLQNFLKFLFRKSPSSFSWLIFIHVEGSSMERPCGGSPFRSQLCHFLASWLGMTHKPFKASSFLSVKWVDSIYLRLYMKWLHPCSASSRCSLNPSLSPFAISSDAIWHLLHPFLYPFLDCKLGTNIHILGNSLYSEYGKYFKVILLNDVTQQKWYWAHMNI